MKKILSIIAILLVQFSLVSQVTIGSAVRLPSQTGNSGKVLGTNGTTLSWVTSSGASSTFTNATLTGTTTITGTVTAPTPTVGSNNNSVATTSFVTQVLTAHSSTLIIPLADVTTTLTTAVPIGLTFTVEANSTYIVRGVMRNSVSSTGGIKFSMTTPTLTVSSNIGVVSRGSSASSSLWTLLPSNGSLTGVMNTVASSAIPVFLEGTITTGASSGTLDFFFGSGVSGQTSQVYSSGTYFELVKY